MLIESERCGVVLREVIAVLLIAGASSTAVATASPSNPEGAWMREDGAGIVQIARCGSALCGRIAWLRDPAGPGRVGDKVFYDMNRIGTDRWKGSAHNPEDGRDYDGEMVLSGQRLITRGCAFGGMICKTVRFSRQR